MDLLNGTQYRARLNARCIRLYRDYESMVLDLAGKVHNQVIQAALVKTSFTPTASRLQQPRTTDGRGIGWPLPSIFHLTSLDGVDRA